MRKTIFCILLLFLTIKTYSQNKNICSIETDANYYYYFIGDHKANNFNYGFSLLISHYIRNWKLSTGINYSTKYYDSAGSAFYSTEKHKHYLQYLNFPITANIKIFSRNKFSSSILAGFVFNHIIDYKVKFYYMNGNIATKNNLLANRQLGVSFMLGSTFSQTIENKWILNLSPFVSCSLVRDHKDQRPDYTNIPNNNLFIGLKIGVEYIFLSVKS